MGNLAMAFEAAAPADIELAWGKRVDAPFKRKVIEISAELGIDPNYLMAGDGVRKHANLQRFDSKPAHQGDGSHTVHAIYRKGPGHEH